MYMSHLAIDIPVLGHLIRHAFFTQGEPAIVFNLGFNSTSRGGGDVTSTEVAFSYMVNMCTSFLLCFQDMICSTSMSCLFDLHLLPMS